MSCPIGAIGDTSNPYCRPGLEEFRYPPPACVRSENLRPPESARAFSVVARIRRANSSGVSCANSSEKGSNRTASMPSDSMARRRCPIVMSSFGARSGASTCAGCGSKGQDDRHQTRRRGNRPQASHDLPMAGVHAVEVADGHSGRAESTRELPPENGRPHRSARRHFDLKAVVGHEDTRRQSCLGRGVRHVVSRCE